MTIFVWASFYFLLVHSVIEGVWSGVLLPINHDDSIDWSQLKREVSALLESNVDGIYTSGTAEELWTLTDKEFTTLGDIVSSAASSSGKPFQIGCSHPSPQVTLSRLRIASQRWPKAIAYQVALPDWFPVSDHEAQTFLKTLNQISSSLVLYNPGNAKKVLLPSDYSWSSNITENVIGLKLVDGDNSWYSSMRSAVLQYEENRNDTLSIGVPGHHFATGFSQKVATCSYSNVAALSPNGAAKWYEQMKSDIEGALDLEKRIDDFFTQYIVPFAKQGYSDMALDKLLAVMGNWVNGTTTEIRWPYDSIPQTGAEKLRTIVRKELPELF